MKQCGKDAGKDYLGSRRRRTDRRSSVVTDASERGLRYYYRCILEDCGRAWRTTTPGMKLCPFCKRSGGVQDRTGVRRSEF